jgi:hypothetical protein
MVAAHGKILVIGGEANASSAQSKDDPALIHVLDTGKPCYEALASTLTAIQSRSSIRQIRQPHGN